MPSIAVFEPLSSQVKKDKKNKMKADMNVEFDSLIDKKSKKEKKSKKSKASDSDSEELKFDDSEQSWLEKKKSKKKDKKRKASEVDDEDEDERSETISELVEPMNLKAVKKKKKMKLEEEEEEEGDDEGKDENPNAVSNFRISAPLREMLKSKGIESLFPIQAMTFDTILDGSDLVGRARTGQGKTLAFVLPILESLTCGPAKAAKTGYGRSPSVLVLLPTRELATQVFADFEVYGGALGLTSCCLYGGAPYHTQQNKLTRGVDIVVGTPGRIKDHIERENIDFSSLKFRVLDEADEMLRMGFVEDVELILGKVEDASKVQTLLFSATLPDWVKHIAARFQKSDKKTVDLVGNEKMKASTNVRHIIIPCSSSARAQLIPDVIRCYSSGGRTIIFTETKDSASVLSGILPGARALHGDIQQAQREVTLSGFRSGKFMTLVATNVAARGLDINDVQLIIQCEPPRDVEAYIHRSGRTGRAGNTGVAVMLYDPRRSNISRIERESGVKFEHIAAPQPADIAEAAGSEAAETITQVSDSVIPIFKSAAEELLNASGLSPVELLAKALAKTAGYTEIKSRSLLSSMENHVTVLLESGRPMYTLSFVYGVLRRFLPEEKVESVKGIGLTADGKGAVFDVPAEDLDMFLAEFGLEVRRRSDPGSNSKVQRTNLSARSFFVFFRLGQENAAGVSLDVVKELPRLQERDQSRGGRFGSGGRGGFADRRSGGGGRFSGGRGGFSDRRNDRFSKGGSRNNSKW
ncbi:DEAD-box ATP-dependent RNA helicase 7-like isoform X3 [Actinidia eriantha]|uniref:DEAD-box ATP-dependent RNA helicase 7-like isoform X3 n=1 Tax=Actinidia eriantha TaxID=165200 RepID=UPI00258DC970|nr:DEAD-box ATP-dependent RNA helicase 7-like isoform X3 [Actinidia eriantha]